MHQIGEAADSQVETLSGGSGVVRGPVRSSAGPTRVGSWWQRGGSGTSYLPTPFLGTTSSALTSSLHPWSYHRHVSASFTASDVASGVVPSHCPPAVWFPAAVRLPSGQAALSSPYPTRVRTSPDGTASHVPPAAPRIKCPWCRGASPGRGAGALHLGPGCAEIPVTSARACFWAGCPPGS